MAPQDGTAQGERGQRVRRDLQQIVRAETQTYNTGDGTVNWPQVQQPQSPDYQEYIVCLF